MSKPSKSHKIQVCVLKFGPPSGGEGGGTQGTPGDSDLKQVKKRSLETISNVKGYKNNWNVRSLKTRNDNHRKYRRNK